MGANKYTFYHHDENNNNNNGDNDENESSETRDNDKNDITNNFASTTTTTIQQQRRRPLLLVGGGSTTGRNDGSGGKTTTTTTTTNCWSFYFMKLTIFKSRFGHVNPSSVRDGITSEEEIQLGCWLDDQRQKFRAARRRGGGGGANGNSNNNNDAPSIVQVQMLRAVGCTGFEEDDEDREENNQDKNNININNNDNEDDENDHFISKQQGGGNHPGSNTTTFGPTTKTADIIMAEEEAKEGNKAFTTTKSTVPLPPPPPTTTPGAASSMNRNKRKWKGIIMSSSGEVDENMDTGGLAEEEDDEETYSVAAQKRSRSFLVINRVKSLLGIRIGNIGNGATDAAATAKTDKTSSFLAKKKKGQKNYIKPSIQQQPQRQQQQLPGGRSAACMPESRRRLLQQEKDNDTSPPTSSYQTDNNNNKTDTESHQTVAAVVVDEGDKVVGEAVSSDQHQKKKHHNIIDSTTTTTTETNKTEQLMEPPLKAASRQKKLATTASSSSSSSKNRHQEELAMVAKEKKKKAEAGHSTAIIGPGSGGTRTGMVNDDNPVLQETATPSADDSPSAASDADARGVPQQGDPDGDGDDDGIVGPAAGIIVRAVAYKRTSTSRLGLTLEDHPKLAGGVIISDIDPTSIFATSDLRVGMKIFSINDMDFQSRKAKAAAIFLKDYEGNVTICAATTDDDTSSNSPPTATGTSAAAAASVPTITPTTTTKEVEVEEEETKPAAAKKGEEECSIPAGSHSLSSSSSSSSPCGDAVEVANSTCNTTTTTNNNNDNNDTTTNACNSGSSGEEGEAGHQSLILPAVGSRIAVYWSGDEEYYEGEVTKTRKKRTEQPGESGGSNNKNNKNSIREYRIDYDDGETEWLDLTKYKFKIPPHPSEAAVAVGGQPEQEQEEPKKKRAKGVSWWVRFEQLKEFQKRVGHLQPRRPRKSDGDGNYDDVDEGLYLWLASQRSHYRNGIKLSLHQIQLLRQIGTPGFEEDLAHEKYHTPASASITKTDAEEESDGDDDDDEEEEEEEEEDCPSTSSKMPHPRTATANPSQLPRPLSPPPYESATGNKKKRANTADNDNSMCSGKKQKPYDQDEGMDSSSSSVVEEAQQQQAPPKKKRRKGGEVQQQTLTEEEFSDWINQPWKWNRLGTSYSGDNKKGEGLRLVDSGVYCTLCKKALSSKKATPQHLSGDNHRRLVQLQRLNKAETETGTPQAFTTEPFADSHSAASALPRGHPEAAATPTVDTMNRGSTEALPSIAEKLDAGNVNSVATEAPQDPDLGTKDPIVVAVALRPTATSRLGLDVEDHPEGGIVIKSIHPTSIFKTSGLRAGMEIISVNNIDCRSWNSAAVANIFEDYTGTVTIRAAPSVDYQSAIDSDLTTKDPILATINPGSAGASQSNQPQNRPQKTSTGNEKAIEPMKMDVAPAVQAAEVAEIGAAAALVIPPGHSHPQQHPRRMMDDTEIGPTDALLGRAKTGVPMSTNKNTLAPRIAEQSEAGNTSNVNSTSITGAETETGTVNDNYSMTPAATAVPTADSPSAAADAPQDADQGPIAKDQIVVAVAVKQSSASLAGLELKNHPKAGVVIKDIYPTSIFKASSLQVGMKIISINDTDCRSCKAKKAAEIVKDCAGSITIRAVTDAFPEDFKRHPNAAAATKAVATVEQGRAEASPATAKNPDAGTGKVNNTATTGTGPVLDMPMLQAVSTAPSADSPSAAADAPQGPDQGPITEDPFVVAMAFRPTPTTQLGLRLKDHPEVGVVIHDILSTSIFKTSRLRPGMKIISINDIDCRALNRAEVANSIKDYAGPITILAATDTFIESRKKYQEDPATPGVATVAMAGAPATPAFLPGYSRPALPNLAYPHHFSYSIQPPYQMPWFPYFWTPNYIGSPSHLNPTERPRAPPKK